MVCSYLGIFVPFEKLKIRAFQRKLHQMACKPGSVDLKRDGWPFIWDICYQTPRATYPGDSVKTRHNAAPIRSCSRWGLPYRNCCQFRGALLPHPFTLTWQKARRFAFCGTFPRVAPAGRYPASCSHGARTFLSPAGFPIAEERPSSHLMLLIYALSGCEFLVLNDVTRMVGLRIDDL